MNTHLFTALVQAVDESDRPCILCAKRESTGNLRFTSNKEFSHTPIMAYTGKHELKKYVQSPVAGVAGNEVFPIQMKLN